MSARSLTPQREHGYFGPHADATFQAEEAEAAVDIEETVFLTVKAGPLSVDVLNGTPLEAEEVDAELHAMGMAGEGEMNVLGMIEGDAFPM